MNSRFAAISPQVSFNFGARDGWSYISGGIGWSTFTAERQDEPLPDPESRIKTINYGGGARWFAKKHLAVSMDLRFYAVNPQLPTSLTPRLSADDADGPQCRRGDSLTRPRFRTPPRCGTGPRGRREIR